MKKPVFTLAVQLQENILYANIQMHTVTANTIVVYQRSLEKNYAVW